ncbi:MAG: hypothetical protein AB7E09_07700 [Candidatus Izemoplasmatales bacterium]
MGIDKVLFENYMCKQKVLDTYYNDYYHSLSHENNFYDYHGYYELRGFVFDDIAKFRYYEFNGVTEDSFIEVLKKYRNKLKSTIKYNDLIYEIDGIFEDEIR